MANRMNVPIIHQRGWLDTRERIREGLAADPYISALFSRNADLGILRDNKTDVISAAITICCGIRYLSDNKPMPQLDYIISLAIGELMSPVLPNDLCLDAITATAELEKILTTLMSRPNIYTRRHTVEDWINQMAVADDQEDEEDDEAAEGGNEAPGDRPGVRAAEVIGGHIRNDRYDEITMEHKIEFLVWLALHLQQAQYLGTVALIITSYVGVAKRGTISERFIEKVQTGIEAELGVDVQLSSEVIRQTYTMFGRYINADNAAQIFERWLEDIPEHALRLRLTLTQVTGSGLTAFVIVGRAMIKYNTFNWAKMNVLTGGEIASFNAAVETVRGNAYYGFNRDLGAARSTLYSSLAYTAKELLIKLNGETSLKNYRGWIKKPKSATIIDTMIAQYVDDRTAQMQAAVTDANDELFFTHLRANLNVECELVRLDLVIFNAVLVLFRTRDIHVL